MQRPPDQLVDRDGRAVPLQPDGLRIGRDPDNDLVLDAEDVSRHHARIDRRNGSVVVVDLASTNGTLVNGEPLRDGERPLQPGDEVLVGDRRFRVVDGDATVAADGTPPPTVARGPLAAAPGETVTIGRHPSNDVVLDDVNVSRFHAQARTQDGRVVLRDLGSRNGTWLRGARVGEVVLEPGDEVGIGPYRLVHDGEAFRDVRERGAPAIDACDLAPAAGRRALGPVTFHVEPGELVAIIGRSGCGKSSLVRALAGVREPVDGEVLLDGEPVRARRTDVGYLPQHEVVHGALTPREALRHAGRLRLPPDIAREELDARVDATLRELSLEHRGDSRIDRLSGGERRRAGLAVELLGDPGVLILDEPTTGLDPGLERQTMELLRRLADGRRTVVVVTHTTASLDLCDRLVVLGPDGRLAYAGPPAGAPAALGVAGHDAIYDAVQDGAQAGGPGRRTPRQAGPAAPRPARPGLAWVHVRTLVRRSATLLVRDRRNLAILLGQVPLLALAIAFLFDGDVFSRGARGNPTDAAQVLFLLTTVAIWFGALSAAREVVKERVVVARERAVGVGLPAYLASKLAVLGVVVVGQVAVLGALVAALRPLHASAAAIGAAFAVLAATALAALALGLLLSALARSEDQAMSFLPLLLLPQLLFAGAIVPASKMGPILDAISHAVLARWSFSGIGTALDMNGRLQTDAFDREHSPYGRSFFDVDPAVAGGVVAAFLVLALLATAAVLRHRLAR